MYKSFKRYCEWCECFRDGIETVPQSHPCWNSSTPDTQAGTIEKLAARQSQLWLFPQAGTQGLSRSSMSLFWSKMLIARFDFHELCTKKRISILLQKSDILSLDNSGVPSTWERHNYICFTTSFTMTPGCMVTVTPGFQGWLCGT
jgi:hypothetical protein